MSNFSKRPGFPLEPFTPEDGDIPPGGTAGQVLVKSSDNDYETSWQTAGATQLKWVDYVANWSQEPTTAGATSDGEVLTYTYGTTTLYRLVPNDTTSVEDSFYTTFSNNTLSGLIISRGMAV